MCEGGSDDHKVSRDVRGEQTDQRDEADGVDLARDKRKQHRQEARPLVRFFRLSVL
jgi:hypothetical protein